MLGVFRAESFAFSLSISELSQGPRLYRKITNREEEQRSEMPGETFEHSCTRLFLHRLESQVSVLGTGVMVLSAAHDFHLSCLSWIYTVEFGEVTG